MKKTTLIFISVFIMIGVAYAQNPFWQSGTQSQNPYLQKSVPTPVPNVLPPQGPQNTGPQPKLNINSIVKGIQRYYDVADGMKAVFVQEATIKSINKVQNSRGRVYFKKPGKMAWIYEEPTQQKVVSDGLYLWMYLPENKQVIKNRTNQAFLTDTPQNFLSGLGDISRDFRVKYAPPIYDAQKNVLLELEPRNPQVSWTKVFIAARPIVFNGEDLYQIVQTNIYDRFGNMNKITFYDIEAYAAQNAHVIPDSVFIFIPPADAKIIEPPATLQAR
jgi:outer membrane lipoprotein carrier protein